MYADDGQLYTSDTDPVSLERRISHEVSSANAWERSMEWLQIPANTKGWY